MAFCKKTLLRKWAFLQRPFPKKSLVNLIGIAMITSSSRKKG